MIVPMKKVSVVVTDKSRQDSLEKLRELGVVHLEKRNVASDGLSKLFDRKAKIEGVQGILRSYEKQAATSSSNQLKDDGDLISQVLSLSDEKKNLQEQLTNYAKERNRIEKWGNFSPASLKQLAEDGLTLILYNLTLKSYEAVSKDKDQKFIVLSRDKSSVYGLAVDKEIPGELPFPLPEYSISELDKLSDNAKKRLSEIETKFISFASQKGRIDSELKSLAQDIEFETAKIGMTATEETPAELTVAWLSGYIPHTETNALKRASSQNGWALLIDDPKDDDNPPTLVKNNAFIRLIQPLFGLLGTVPGYREYDISLSYLLFFSFFFAMIFGDAGYGVILFIIALIFAVKAKKASGKVPDGILLLGLLATTTMVWGYLTGSFFAINSSHPFFQPKIPFLASEQNIKWLCFIVGTVQLSLAHLKNIKKALPSLTALAQIGWLAMVIGLYFLVLNLVLSRTEFPVPPFATYLIGGGLVTYFIFAEQKGGNFFKNVGKSFANFLPTFLSAVSSFSDIISYIRLFAVGLAGSAIAGAFNEMAGAMPPGAPQIIGGGLILLFGHGLNLTMNALSVVVHGVRLNLLEYAGHLGMEWSGYSYSPFALKKKQD